MLRAGDEIDANVVRYFRVIAAIERGVDERGGAATAPVFAR